MCTPQCHTGFNQYLRFLLASLDDEELTRLMPSLARLYQEFGLSWEMSYQIIRPQLYRSLYVSSMSFITMQTFPSDILTSACVIELQWHRLSQARGCSDAFRQ